MKIFRNIFVLISTILFFGFVGKLLQVDGNYYSDLSKYNQCRAAENEKEMDFYKKGGLYENRTSCTPDYLGGFNCTTY